MSLSAHDYMCFELMITSTCPFRRRKGKKRIIYQDTKNSDSIFSKKLLSLIHVLLHLLKRYPKIDNSVIVYPLSCHSKPV